MYSDYFERDIEIDNDVKETLLNIYERVAKQMGFEPDYESRELVDFEEDTALLDTVLYHVNVFGKNHEDYGSISHVFEDVKKTEIEISVESIERFDDNYLEGVVVVDGEKYSFDYNVETEAIDVHCYSEPSWLDGSSYEKPLPNVVMENMEDVLGAVSDAVDEFLEEEVVLPECVRIPFDALELDEHILEDDEWLGDVIGDYLSDKYGYCHLGFQFHRGYDSETQKLSEFFVTDIQWDVDKEQDHSIVAGSLDDKILEAAVQAKESVGEVHEPNLGER